MKKFYLLALFVFLSVSSQAQGFTYNFIIGYLEGQGYTIRNELHGNAAQGYYIYTNSMRFYEGTEYCIVAFSEDNDVKDVDLGVYTSWGSLYDEDRTVSQLAKVTFTPSYTQDFTVRATNYSSNTPYYQSRVNIIIAYR